MSQTDENELKYLEDIQLLLNSYSNKEFLSPFVVFTIVFVVLQNSFKTLVAKTFANLIGNDNNFNLYGILILSCISAFMYIVTVQNLEKLNQIL